MDRMIYLSMAGAKATMQRQELLSHNLANASTQGFRAEMQAFRAVPVRGDGATTRVYALETSTGHDPSPGPVTRTGRPLDVAMKGQAWLAVQGNDGTEAYTRQGVLEVDAQGQLVGAGGRPVLGEGGPISVPPDGQVAIGADGTVSVRQANGTVQAQGRLKLVTPEAPLRRGEDGLFRPADGAPLDADPQARLQDESLEGSNVDAVGTMVAMIAAARQFESQMKLLQSAERNEESAGRLLSMDR